MSTIGRRTFLAASALAPLAGKAVTVFPKPTLTGSLKPAGGEAPIADGQWFTAPADGDGFEYRFAPGFLKQFHSLTSDMLLDGNTMVVFLVTLQEGENGGRFTFRFAGLSQCSFRMRMALALTDQNRWQSGRDGAFLKPMVGGDRVDLTKVDRLTLVVSRTAGSGARFCMTPLTGSGTEVPKLSRPVLPKGPLVDRLGQSRLHDWPGKTLSVEALTGRLQKQWQEAPKQKFPSTFSKWGGDGARRLAEPSGFFRTHHDGRRWWLVDPDGYPFYSAGVDCVRVDCEARIDGIESALEWKPDRSGEFAQAYTQSGGKRAGAEFVNYLAANFIRTFGSEWRTKWSTIALAELRRLRFNTVGNWSDWENARDAGFAYVRPMSFAGRETPFLYRDFPDVFYPRFESDAAEYASQLSSSVKDPALIGYFLMNEPTWGFSKELPAAGMLYNSVTAHSRTELARFLKTKYDTDTALASGWAMPVTFTRIEKGKFEGVLTPQALKDLRDFSVRMVERYFQVLSHECRKADPHHLNLGMRWAGVPPEWAVEGMKFFDVFSLNCYMEKLPMATSEKINQMLHRPVMIGEWHFGALDAGLPASGIGRLPNQQQRADAYRVYFEDAAANPNCVGAHWFTLYDQSALGRFDGENYNIGFLDICNRPYDEMSKAAIASHERMYSVARSQQPPFTANLNYLPKLFL